MRVHHLRIEAFGPFPEIVDIDLDALSAEGLFLIHGPTGSGKTSLLDAICYALYADVPGARSKKGLRSDHAADGAVPRVTLELTAGGRRLRIVRSPEFSRPKKRGSGQFTVNARVTLEERCGTDWLVRGSRNDEVADVVKDVLGMGMAQFASVVLLPQGDFATFLRATPDDRRAVLERLFDITEYRDVEDWLAEARRAARADLQRARITLTGELARVEDVLVDAGPALSDPSDPAGPADSAAAAPEDAALASEPEDASTAVAGSLPDLPPESVTDHLSMLLTNLDARVSRTMADYDDAVGVEHRATEALERARVAADLRARGAKAESDLEVLAALGEEHDARVLAVAAADRATGLGGHLAARARSRGDLRVALGHVRAARSSLSDPSLNGLADADVAKVAAALRAHDPTALGLRREAEESMARSVRASHLEATASTLAVEDDAVHTARQRTEQVAADLDVEVADLSTVAATVPELTLRLTSAHELLDRLGACDVELARVAELAPERDARRSIALDHRQDLLELRARRLDQMAGELAASLSPGASCPVCGSADHPEPASTTDPVRPEHLAAAELRLEEAERAYRALHEETETHRHRAEALRATLADTDRPTLQNAVLELTSTLDSARACAARHEVALRARVTHTVQVDSLRRRSASVTAQRVATTRQITALDAEEVAGRTGNDVLATAHASCPCGTVDPDEHFSVGVLLSGLLGAVDDLAAARQRADAVESDLAAALADAGFESADAARAVALSRDDLACERALVTAHRERIAAAHAVTSDPDVATALHRDPPDLPALVEGVHTARQSLLAARTGVDGAERTRRALGRLLPVVTRACAAVLTTSERESRVREVADTVCGTGPENTLRMRLTSFVLAARLEKVAALANERLAVMGGGRYLLEHSDDLAARGARSGLGLRVLDQWTGRTRDTATLSGGESFMASLALALGLADAVREEAGGFDLGTLFIDEGFGTLDDDSLEQVLTVLDGLREGGRAVAVVSHVADLRARITHQAVVCKGPTGSTVEVRLGVVTEPAA